MPAPAYLKIEITAELVFITNNHGAESSDSFSEHGVGLWLDQDEEVSKEAAFANDQRALSVPT